MKKRNLQLLALGLFLVLTQNSLAVKLQEGTGSEAASDETVAVGLSYTDSGGTVHKNIAGNPAEPGEKYFATAIGIANKASAWRSSAFGSENTASGEYSSAFGFHNTASVWGSSAFGFQNTASAWGSSAFGCENIASGKYSSAFGHQNEASGEKSLAFGYKNIVGKLKKDGSGNLVPDENYGKDSLVFGSEYKVTGNSSGAFGVGGDITWNSITEQFNYKYINEGNNSYMIGNKNKIAEGSDDNFILGNGVAIAAGVQKSVVLGDGSASGGSNTVSVGSSTLQRKIVNVGEGEISATSTDAITGKQLYTGEGIDTAAWKAKLGVGAGGVDLSAYAKRNASNLTASDISAWQTSLDVTKKADYKDANDIDVNKWKAKLGVGSGGGGGAIDAYTKDEADNKFANKTDLNDYTKKDDYIDANGIDVDKWKAKLGTGAGSADIQNLRNEVYEKIDNVKDEVRDVGSLSAALAGLHPMQYDPKAPAQVMAALGHYKDRQAVAVGASYYFNDRFMMSTGIALSGEKKTKTMANIGFTLKLGKGSGVTYNETPQYVVQNEVKRLTVENQELKSKVNNQDRENQELKERVQKLEEKLNMLLKNK